MIQILIFRGTPKQTNVVRDSEDTEKTIETMPSHNDEALRFIMNALPYPSTFV
jgi:hypothetical protein